MASSKITPRWAAPVNSGVRPRMKELGAWIPALAVIFLGLVLLALPLQARLFRTLRERHTRLHGELGSPEMFRPSSAGYATPRMWRFLLLREHRGLGDRQLSCLADTLLAVVSSAVAILLLAFLGRALA